ncbi:MAG: hypothetical protein KGN32_14735 [Burkholderiales bacterium]|nr:hypothetical protein [Burkholderiales bacterium]
MATVGPTLAQLEAWERIKALPEDYPLKTAEAAVFITFSVATLERLRTKGTGPDYFQGGIRRDGSQPAPEGTNQHVRYFKPDILAWRQRGMVSSTMQAAKLKGQVFATIFDLAEQHPFYIDPADGGVAGMVEHTPIETVIARLGSWDIVWMSATEAASQRWSNLVAHKELASKIQSVLSNMQSGINAALEATEISEGIPRTVRPIGARTVGGPL